MDPYGTHQYILEAILQNREVTSVLETGMGFNSTPLFLYKCCHVCSIEMQDPAWYFRIVDVYGNKTNFEPLLMLGTEGAIKHIEKCSDLGMVFIDGHGKNRWQQINVSFWRTNIIVAHDTEAMIYHWEKVSLPSGWLWVDFTRDVPWTSVIVQDLSSISFLLNYPHEIYNDISRKVYTNTYTED